MERRTLLAVAYALSTWRQLRMGLRERATSSLATGLALRASGTKRHHTYPAIFCRYK